MPRFGEPRPPDVARVLESQPVARFGSMRGEPVAERPHLGRSRPMEVSRNIIAA